MPRPSSVTSSTIIVLAVAILLPNLSIVADTGNSNPVNSKPTANPHPGLLYLTPRVSPDEISPIEEDAKVVFDESEVPTELQELLNQEHESHLHLGGKLILDEEANFAHPSLDDVDGVEVDLSIDFE